MKLSKLAEAFEEKLKNITEHPGVDPVSYMAFQNLKTISNDCTEILSLLNDKDDLPQWVDELLAIAKFNVSKALDYIRAEKVVVKKAQSYYDISDQKAKKLDFSQLSPENQVLYDLFLENTDGVADFYPFWSSKDDEVLFKWGRFQFRPNKFQKFVKLPHHLKSLEDSECLQETGFISNGFLNCPHCAWWITEKDWLDQKED